MSDAPSKALRQITLDSKHPTLDSYNVNIAVLGNEQSWYVADLQRAAQMRGHVCERIDFRKLSSDVRSLTEISHRTNDQPLASLLDYDVVIVRTMPPGSLEQVVFRMDLLQRIQSYGVRVVNSPKAVECAVDKYLTTSLLAHANLPVPRTIVCEDSDQALEAFHQLGGDIVLKPIFGSEGRGITRITDEDVAFRVFRTLARLNSVLYLQQFVDHAGFDIRVLVLDGKILGSMKRSNALDFRTNVSRQATAESHVASSIEQEYALRAISAVDARMGGVDLLYNASGNCFVIEVNAVPGWRAFQKATKIDVAACLIESLENEE